MRPRPLLGSDARHGPAFAEYRHSPLPVGHGVAAVGLSGVVYLVLASKVWDAMGVMVVLVIIVFLTSTCSSRVRRPGDNPVCCLTQREGPRL
jgi:hypothetical protein